MSVVAEDLILTDEREASRLWGVLDSPFSDVKWQRSYLLDSSECLAGQAGAKDFVLANERSHTGDGGFLAEQSRLFQCLKLAHGFRISLGCLRFQSSSSLLHLRPLLLRFLVALVGSRLDRGKSRNLGLRPSVFRNSDELRSGRQRLA